LNGFVEVMGVVTNVHKSIVVLIRCANIDLDEIMEILPIQRANFPIKYLGLPLTHRSIKNIDVQPLVDKVASKLVPWHGKNIAAARRCTLVKSVITSQAIFTSRYYPSLPVLCLLSTRLKELSFGRWWIRYPGENARLIGILFVGPRRRVVLASLTLTSLQGPLG
jgi:hypothetical protein